MLFRHAGRVRGGEVDHEPHHCLCNEVAAANAEAANFNQAFQLCRGADAEVASFRGKQKAIIAHQVRRRYMSGAPGQDQLEGEARLAGA